MTYVFGDCELDTERYELRVSGERCHVEPQVFDLLAYLLAHRDRVVGREELLAQVWGHTFVSEATLSSRVMAARKAIGDSGREQALIRTVHGRGYQFVADTEELADSGSTPPATESTPGEAGLEGSETRYASSGELSIAFRTFGSGPPDIIIAPGFVSHVDEIARSRYFSRIVRELAHFSRVIVFDKREQGLSDRVGRPPTIEEMVDDMLAVLDAAGSERPVVVGTSEGGPMAILLATAHPHTSSSGAASRASPTRQAIRAASSRSSSRRPSRSSGVDGVGRWGSTGSSRAGRVAPTRRRIGRGCFASAPVPAAPAPC